MRIAYISKTPPPEMEREDKIFTFFELPQSLTAFASSLVLKDYDHIIFNLCDSVYSQPHILSAIQILKQYISSEITIVKEDNEDTSALFVYLQNYHVTNLIASRNDSDTQKQLSDCINGRKSLAYIAKTKMAGALAINVQDANLTFTIPTNVNIRIVVIGASIKIGATTHSFGIYNYCKSLGFKPLLVDKTGLHMALQSYETTEVDDNNFLNIHNIRFDINEHFDNEAVNVNITDVGCDIASNMTDILSADIVVLVCGTKISEILPLAEQLAKLSDIEDERRINIVSFAVETDFDEISKTLPGKSIMATYHPDIWSENNLLYSQILRAPLKKLCSKL